MRTVDAPLKELFTSKETTWEALAAEQGASKEALAQQKAALEADKEKEPAGRPLPPYELMDPKQGRFEPGLIKLLGAKMLALPTLQVLHRNIAASPRSTAVFFLLMEELSYRHLYRVDRAFIGNFRIRPACNNFMREDDFASNGLRGLADFVTALFKCIESQARGFAHGHGKVHSIPDGTLGLLRCLEEVIEEIKSIEAITSSAKPRPPISSPRRRRRSARRARWCDRGATRLELGRGHIVLP